MAENDPKPHVAHNAKASRFEYAEDGHTAFAAYELRPDVMVLTHTEVPKELGGRGVANQLAAAAFEHARANNLRVVTVCPFMSKWVEKNPRYREVVRD
jgi:predicted GNAT family acetyltransferase